VALPGVRTRAQVRELVGALAHGPLDAEQLAAVDRLLLEPGRMSELASESCYSACAKRRPSASEAER
jgi:hypothetical protein